MESKPFDEIKIEISKGYREEDLKKLTKSKLKECYNLGYIFPIHYHKELMRRDYSK